MACKDIKGTVTGRFTTNGPNMQSIKPPGSTGYAEMRDTMVEARKAVYWHGNEPSCELSSADYPHALAGVFIDGKVVGGGWALMCQSCHSRLGVGLGMGRGQKYTKQPDSRWLKVGG